MLDGEEEDPGLGMLALLHRQAEAVQIVHACVRVCMCVCVCVCVCVAGRGDGKGLRVVGSAERGNCF